MDRTKFDNMLMEQLNDLSSAKYSANMRTVALSNAVRAFSRYFPVMRRYGTGALYANASAAAAIVVTVGGPFNTGDDIILDPWGTPVTHTITDTDPPATDLLVGAPTSLDISPVLAAAHFAGEDVSRETVGLTLVDGQSTYLLPLDFIRVDQESFDLAIGARAEVKRSPAYYDAVYEITAALSGIGFGSRQNYGYGQTYPISGNPLNNPNMGMFPRSSTIFRFITDVARPRLEVIPTPTAQSARTLDFYYNASHIIETVPDSELDAVMSYALYDCYKQQLAKRAAQLKWQVDDVTQDPNTAARTITDAMNLAKTDWDQKVRCRPMMISG
jgi:hypothetical protein